MTWRRLEMKRWFGLLGTMLALVPLGCMQQTTMRCDPEETIRDGVTMTKCRGIGPSDSTLLKIDKFRSNSELWVLEALENGQSAATPQTLTGVGFAGLFLNESTFQARSQALVQINGFTFSCDPDDSGSRDNSCYNSILPQYPTTTVYESTKRLSNFELTPDPESGTFGQSMFTFKPRGPGPLMEVSDEGSVPGNEMDLGYYNAMGNSWPHLIDRNSNGELDEGECIPGPSPDVDDPSDWTILGISDTHVIMFYIGGVYLNDETCAFLISNLVGARMAFQMDGGGSAGMYLQGNISIGHTGSDIFDFKRRHIPYRVGLVTLEEWNRVQNGGFEDPELSRMFGETPPGYHSYSGDAIQRDVLWDGAMFLYNTPIYNEWVSGHGTHRENFLPSHGEQVAAIRPRGDDTNHITQNLTVPANRYCMLHFFHGYNRRSPQCPDDSKLNVRTETCPPAGQQSTTLTTADYSSLPTVGRDVSLNEVWLRLLTPDNAESGSNTCMRLSFTANKEDDDTPGNCEVLLDDVSVSCVQ